MIEDEDKPVVDGKEDAGFDIQIIPDDADTKKPVAKPAETDDEDYGEYSAKVQRRIDKEVRKRRDAERDRDAERVQRTNMEQQLRQAGTRIDQTDLQTVAAEERRIAAEIANAQRAFREAREKGDVDAESLALGTIAEAKADKKALDLYKADRRLPGKETQVVEQQQEQRQQPKLHRLAVEWKEDNEDWFEKKTPEGRRMTSMAYAIDQELAEEGFDVSSPDYYAELSKRVQKQFPEHFKRAAGRAQPVAEVTRPAAAVGKRKVSITESAALQARKLGLTIAQYSAYVKTDDE